MFTTTLIINNKNNECNLLSIYLRKTGEKCNDDDVIIIENDQQDQDTYYTGEYTKCRN